MKYKFVSMRDNYGSIACNFITLHVNIYMMQVEINESNFDILIKSHVNIIIMHFDIIYLA